ncbi:restriction endonuclease subunit S [Parabacteroides sp. CT06]|uniref:restriction endonuclease subunit S n=1 Tax=Parabacteroides sp. CT06 TaxID=2025876 RepID=UPI000B988A07|nr:restriction endonuclease subunit S [Parabacteroides sp. CT06]AST54639.1 restriction endonuclease subunit S [Parabacteroides sp. CT06]
MNGKQLKNSILQWAIQGKLVPQDPNDEPASVLLERIRAEKARLVKEKKIKKDKNESIIYRGEDNSYYEKFLATGEVKCIDDEIPFEIPQGWEWTRIGNIFNHASGKQQSSSNKSNGKPQKFITTSNLYWGYFVLDNIKVMNFTEEEIKTCSATKGDLLVCEGGAGYGRSAIWNYDYDICLQNHVHRLRPLVDGTCEYVYYFMYLQKESNNLTSVGTAMPGLSANRLKSLLIPLPPIAEQNRITDKLKDVFPVVEKYDKAQNEQNLLNSSINDVIKKSILQEAIQGRLVPQITNEGTAQELLEQIKQEKQKLVKEGKLKKSALTDSVIYKGDDNKYYEQIGSKLIDITDDIPFEIPNTWSWVRIGILFAHNNGKQLNQSNSSGKFLEYITTSNLYWDGFNLNNLKKMHFEENEIERNQAVKGDLLVCEGGDVGRACIWEYDLPIMLQNHIHKLRAYYPLCTKYFYYIFYLYNKIGVIGGKGIGIQGFSAKALHNTLVPLPPLNEQERICSRISELFGKIKA